MAIQITDDTMTPQTLDRIAAAAGFRQRTAASGHLRRYLDGQPLLNVVDRSRGY